ncbi:glycosyltransferase [Phascolarctobacterium succinatutens]|uniref:Glycosyl transferase family 1 n=1 Tax=Phascolarctobacterium succinatutens TaxID=626940 RepID=A0A1Q6R6G7_9FIRM|nr:glycosyltransferase [Phascolarctobacterium succinatutens]OLA37961.1 MAG: glycosyl transferase family 1 [Phascolarctobacterium succinatutens]
MKILMANCTKMVQDSGGVAKVACAFSNAMVTRGHKVEVIYTDEKKGEFYFPIYAEVKCKNLNLKENGDVIKFPLYLRILREILRTFSKRLARTVNDYFQEHYLLENMKKYICEFKPDVIVSYQPAASKLILSDLKLMIPVITMSHGDPEDYFYTYPTKELPSLAQSEVCQVLMPSFEDKIKKHMPEVKTITIGNAIPQFEFSSDLEGEKEQHKIIFVGRLNRNHKRPHLLIKAFDEVANRYPDWILELWGAKDKANYYNEMKKIIKDAHLEKRVLFKGFTDDVPNVLREADIFAFPSAYEGFGMALAEGMSVGLPAIGYKNCPAVNELIKDGKTGFLCDDGVEPLAHALEKLMSDKELRVKMGKAAKADMAQFAPEKIWDKWEDLMKKIVKK